MKKGQKLWSREELILALNLYTKLPFGRLHSRNPEIVSLAKMLNRTPGALAFKLVNFASLDPSLKSRGIKGAVNTSLLDKEIWNEFFYNSSVLPYESEKLLANLKNTTIEEMNDISETEIPKEGRVREQIVRVRVNQSLFRKSVLASYNNTCCITGIKQTELIIAGHIKPWGIDVENRLNPRNGIAINALHDRAFETGLLTITQDYKIKISPILKKQANVLFIKNNFLKYENKSIILPSKFLPDIEFLKYHSQERFRT